MLSLGLQKNVWVFMEAVDMRKHFDALYGLVRRIHSRPLNGDIFLFLLSRIGKKQNRCGGMGQGLFWCVKD